MPQERHSESFLRSIALTPAGIELMTGYLHPWYAFSLQGFGAPLELSASGGWLLTRPIPSSDRRDAMGCYPLFCCRHWCHLREDLEANREHLVTVALVTDPFGDFDESLLRRCFDRVIPFKVHFVADLTKPIESYTSARHRKYAHRAQRRLCIEVCANPLIHLDRWVELYGALAKKHGITGIRAFSRQAFARQLVVPGMVMFRAVADKETVGLDLWYVQGEVAQGHLAAFSPRGYELHAAYGLKLAIMEYFKDKVRWLNFGGGAGLDKDAGDGLTAFKRGWAGETRMAWFCGRILQTERYLEILRQRGLCDGNYFPAYRQGEYA
jgi:hypothetical protein